MIGEGMEKFWENYPRDLSIISEDEFQPKNIIMVTVNISRIRKLVLENKKNKWT